MSRSQWVAVKGTRARDLLVAVIARVEPHLPPAAKLELTWHEKGFWLRQVGLLSMLVAGEERKGGGGVFAAQAFGPPSIPLLPRQLRRRLAAQQAVETVLRAVYVGSGTNPFDVDFDMKATSRDDFVVVSYRVPGEGDSAGRVELDPIPNTLL